MNANILMVDDSKTIRFQVRKILEAEPDHDYKISEAGDGKEALDFVSASKGTVARFGTARSKYAENEWDEFIRIFKADPFGAIYLFCF